MNAIELTQLFVKFAETKAALEALQAQIEAEVLTIGESRKIAGVKATYCQPSDEVDYQAAAKAAGATPDVISKYQTVTVATSWKGVATEVGADLAQFTSTKPARVVVK
jgi:hypothetical protein